MEEELEEAFPWIPLIKRGFLKSFSGEYEVGILELLQQYITEEIIKVKRNRKRGKMLISCIDYFYYHFCRKWYLLKKFSSQMEIVWVHLLTGYLKICLFLSRGKETSIWIERVKTAIMGFPGEKNLIYDALLSVNCLDKKYQPVYGSVLMHFLVYASLFVPMIINDPAEYLKLHLLFERLNFLIKDPVEKSALQMKASKVLAPSTLSNWLSVHNFNVNWMSKEVRIDLRINLFKKLCGKGCEKEVVETIRKILLPSICTRERKAKLDKPHSDLIETVDFTNKRNNFDEIPSYVIDSSKKRNHGRYDCVSSKDEKEIGVIENDVQNKKPKNCVGTKIGDDVPSAEDIAFNEVETDSKRMKVKRRCVSGDEQKQKGMKKSRKEKQSASICNNVSGAKSKKKKNQRKEDMKMITKMHSDHSFKDIDQGSKNEKSNLKEPKSKELDCNPKEIELVTISQESDTDSLPVIVDEREAIESISKRKLSKFINVNSTTSCSEEEPVILTEIKHFPIISRSSSKTKKSKPIDLKTETGTAEENIIVCDSMAISSIKVPGNGQIKDVKIYASEKKDVTCEKSQSISEDEKDATAPISLTNLHDEIFLSETKSEMEIADESHTFEEKLDSHTDKSSPLKSSHRENSPSESVSNLDGERLISEKDISLLIDKKMDSDKDSRQESGSSVDVMKEKSNYIHPFNQDSLDVLTESLNDSSNQTANLIKNIGDFNSNQTSVKLVDKHEKFSMQVDSKIDTSQDISVHEEGKTALDSSLTNDSCVEKTEVHKFDICPSFEPPKSLNDSSNQTANFIMDLGDINSNHTSVKLVGKNEKFSVQIDSKIDTSQDISIHEEDRPALDSSLNNDSCVGNTNIHKLDILPSCEIDNLVSDTNEINFPKITPENDELIVVNSEVIGTKENLMSCMAEKDKMTQEQRSSDSSVNPSLSDISVLKVDETVQITNSIEVTNEIPIEHSKPGLQKSESCTQSMNSFHSNILSADIETRKENVETYNSLNKSDSETALILSSDGCLEVENPIVPEDNTRNDEPSPLESNLNHQLSCEEMPNLLFNVKTPISKTNDSQRYVDKQILNENVEYKTPNSSAANRLMENMLNLVEKASSENNEFGSPSILKGNLTPTVHSLAQKFLSSVTSPINEISEKCLTFLDISTESNESSICCGSKSPEYLQYRDLMIDLDDIKSEDTLSENKSISKTDASGYPTDASSDTDDEESNYLSDCNSPVPSDEAPKTCNPKNIGEDIVRCQSYKKSFEEKGKNQSQYIAVDNSEIFMLNPVVNLGERCDDKAFILANSNVLLDIKTEDQQINPAPSPNKLSEKPDESEGSPSSECISVTAKCSKISEVKNDAKMSLRPRPKMVDSKPDQEMTVSEEIHQSVESRSEKGQETDEHVSEKEPLSDPKGEVQKPVKLIVEKELKQDEKCQGSTENGKESFMLSLSMRKLRSRPVPTVETDKSSITDKDSSVLNQTSPTTSGRCLRSRNPPALSSQKIRKSRSHTLTRRSSKRLKKEVDIKLDLNFGTLSLNSPKIPRSKSTESLDKSSAEVMKDNTEPPTINQNSPFRRSTRASVISSSVDSEIKDQDADPEGYNLRSRKSVIMPGRLKF